MASLVSPVGFAGDLINLGGAKRPAQAGLIRVGPYIAPGNAPPSMRRLCPVM
jgi:hypothetical protein